MTREDRTAPTCGRCGGTGYVTDPAGADVNVEGVAVSRCPRCSGSGRGPAAPAPAAPLFTAPRTMRGQLGLDTD